MNIKLCGLKTEEDVKVACELEVWAVGFVLTKSPRQISPEICKTLSALAVGVKKVGVFTNESPAEITGLVESCSLDYAQIHGPYTEEDWQALGDLAHIRAFNIKDEASLAQLDSVRGKTFLLDAFVEGVAGGSGKTFDWKLAKEASGYGNVIVAGGLTPENVSNAVKTASPWGVDVSSGIEKEKGVKDHNLMKAFVGAVRTGC
ncbi:MAG: phosphoribosylanthranilate isomerase [Planctomycetota bacterium]|jgi:phosphoribosylanthranilate isomerase